MCNTQITVYVFSHSIDNLQLFISTDIYSSISPENKNNIEIVGDRYRLCILSYCTSGYNSERLNDKLIKHFSSPAILRRQLDMYYLNIAVAYTISGLKKKDSIPGLGLNSALISLMSTLKASIIVTILSSVRVSNGTSSCGAYYYLKSDNEFNVSQINQIAGTSPSIVFGKGDACYSGNKIRDYYCWGIEYTYDDTTPNKPIRELMGRIMNPSQLGLFCKDHDMDSNIDLTYYGLYSEKIEFCIGADFLIFCNKLGVSWIAVDMMF